MHQIQVIVNGDDFGKSPEVNEAIIRAFRAGSLTSCSLMVTGKAFDHAVRLARENSDLAVGIHLVTVQGKSALPHSEIPSLVDRESNFPDSPVAAGLKYYFSRAARHQLTRELAAQFQRFHATGLKLSHVDSHLHMHVHPVIFSATLELAEHYGARCMRVPRDDFWLAVRFQRQDLPGKAAGALAFWLLTRHMKKRLLERGFSFAERVYGHLYSGRMSLEYALFVLEHLSARTNEIYFHPAAFDGGLVSDFQQQQSVRELEILVSNKLRKRLHDAGINLTNCFGLTVNP
jgi:hopanoid biosynthesis associated protein HpnK